MNNLYRRAAQRVLWGDGTIERLRDELARAQAHRPLVLCGNTVGRHPRLLSRVLDHLASSVAGVSTDVRAHSPADSVENIAAQLASTGADSIVAIGGGSAFVTARAACIVHAEQRPLDALATRRAPDGQLSSPRLMKPKLPIIAVPTTPTTAAAKAGSAVTVPGQQARMTMLDPKTRATAVLFDPDFLESSPPELVLQASLNAIVMAVEGLASNRAQIFSDAVLVHAVRQFSTLLPDLGNRSALTPQRRMEAALASILVGDGTDSAGGGLTAALSHTIGHHYRAHNGSVDAILLPHVLRQLPPSPIATENICAALSSDPEQMVDRLWGVFAAAGTPSRLRELGVTSDDLEHVAHSATADAAFGQGASRPPITAAIDILRSAW